MDPMEVLRQLGEIIAAAIGGGGAPADPAAVPMEAAAAPAAGNAAPPDDDTLRMQRDQAAIHQRRLEERVKALEAENRSNVLKLQRRDTEAEVIQLEAEGVRLDRAEEVERLAPLAEDARKAEIVRMRKCYARGPAMSGGFIDTAAPNGVRPANGELTPDQATKARKLALASGKSYEEARQLVVANN